VGWGGVPPEQFLIIWSSLLNKENSSAKDLFRKRYPHEGSYRDHLRLKKGQSQRLIHRKTKIGRKIVKKYYEFAEKNGWLSPEVLMPTPEAIAERLARREKKVTEQHQTSSLESYKSVIKRMVTT